MDYFISTGNPIGIRGELQQPPILPLRDEVLLNNIESGIDSELEIANTKDKLNDSTDTLTVRYSNTEAVFILDEWITEFRIPETQREEIWTADGIQETFIYFVNAQDENWFWLTDAQVDYYDDDNHPVPIFPGDQDE